MATVGTLGALAILWIIWVGISYITASPESAPQQAALAGMTLVGMVFPYTIFRIVATIQATRQQELLERLSKQAKPEKPKAKKTVTPAQ